MFDAGRSDRADERGLRGALRGRPASFPVHRLARGRRRDDRPAKPSPASSHGRWKRDLGTRLDWVAVDHWNTDNPHVHVLVRGRRPTTARTSSSPATTSAGACARAPRNGRAGTRSAPRAGDPHRAGEGGRRPSAGRRLDSGARAGTPTRSRVSSICGPAIRRSRSRDPPPDGRPAARAGAAGPRRAGRSGDWIVEAWRPSATLRDLGMRGDIIKTMHRAFTERRARARCCRLCHRWRDRRRSRSSAGWWSRAS